MGNDQAITVEGSFSETISRVNEAERAPTPTMFIAALFTIARTWKQLKCPSTERWIKKM